MKKLVSIIIINWNGKHYLEVCLPSLSNQDYKNVEIILVDNGSGDGSVEYVKKKFPNVRMIINKKNLGYAEANNIGYRVAKGDNILFLNNDTRVTENFLTELVRVLESDKKIGGVQSKILLMDDSTRLDSVGAFLTNTGFLYHYGVAKKDKSKYNEQIEVYSAKGACMLFRKDVLEKIKINDEILDSRYFAYFEETDMCHRVWLAGYEIVYSPKSVIYHKVGGTTSKMDSAFIQYHSFKNRINTYIKNLETANLVKILPLHLAVCELYAFFSLLKLRFAMFIAVQKAIIWNIRNVKETTLRRRIVQHKIRHIPDSAFFPIIMRKPKLSYFYYLSQGLAGFED